MREFNYVTKLDNIFDIDSLLELFELLEVASAIQIFKNHLGELIAVSLTVLTFQKQHISELTF